MISKNILEHEFSHNMRLFRQTAFASKIWKMVLQREKYLFPLKRSFWGCKKNIDISMLILKRWHALVTSFFPKKLKWKKFNSCKILIIYFKTRLFFLTYFRENFGTEASLWNQHTNLDVFLYIVPYTPGSLLLR